MTPTTTQTDMQPSMLSLGDRPQMAFPGATRSEVKALAMGAARSRAWNIVESTDDRIVAQRPLDPGSAVAQRLASSGVAPGSQVEVTSYFVENRGGVNVGLEAAVLSQVPGSPKPSRTDATEAFRPALTESLESLHTSWSRNRVRVAQAAPPLGAALAADQDNGEGDDGDFTPAQTDAAERRPSAWTNEAAASVIAPSDTGIQSVDDRTPRPPAPIPQSTRQPIPPAPERVAAAPAPRAPEPRRTAGGPAPVVDASPILTRRIPPGPSTQPMSLPTPIVEPAPESIPLADNMMALYPPASGTVSWAYYAEQYARLRGCNVGPQGAIMIDPRSDGEIFKVPCEGADSVMVLCQDGDCRGLL